MPRRPTGSVPALVHHKASNRARVRINGRDFWLGEWGAPEAKMAYGRAHAGPPEIGLGGGTIFHIVRSTEGAMPLSSPTAGSKQYPRLRGSSAA